MRASPPSGTAAPTSTRASVDLPEALCPITPSASPGATSKETPSSTGARPRAPAATLTSRSETRPAISGRAVGRAGAARRSAFVRARCARIARSITGHCPIAWSSGASARPATIEIAMIIPALISPRIASTAPTVSRIDCSIMRSVREAVA